MKEKIVLAYSGGLDTSIIIPWLKDNYDCEVIACCVYIGQDDNMEEVYDKAIASGASDAVVLDLQEEFIKDYAFKGLKAGAIYEKDYLLGTAFARPVIAKALVDVAHQYQATSIAHGCTGKGNDQVRFETGIYAFDPLINIIAPWRIWDIESREDAIDYATAKGIQLSITKEKIYSRDQNLWHISHEGGQLEDLAYEHDEEDLYMMVKPLKQTPDTETIIKITFEQAIPVALNDEYLSPATLVRKLNVIAGENGIGVIDLVENRTVGMKSRGIYESPAASVLV
ncbi:MAG: argininosuccinate synthase, partial [Bacilli bacterium]